jgi:ribosomal protein S18 acetylase RimI-like enzyme
MNEPSLCHHVDGLTSELARDVARLHAAAIDRGFLTSLGEPFLATLYTGLAGLRSSFVITATLHGELLGFICGATDTRRAYLEFARSRSSPRAALTLLPRLFSLRTARRVAETLLYPTQATTVPLPSAEILNFCVTESQRGQGIGRRLFEALAAEFSRRHVDEIRIVTGAEQRSAQAFYDRIGARRVTELEIHEGTKSVVYTYTTRSSGDQHVQDS